jgi:hypothetical protein
LHIYRRIMGVEIRFQRSPARTPIFQGGVGEWSLITPSLWSILPIGCGKEGKAEEAGLPKHKEIA